MAGRRCFGGGGAAGSAFAVAADPLCRWCSLELRRLARDLSELEDHRTSLARITTARSEYAVDLEGDQEEVDAAVLRGGAGGSDSSLSGGGAR